jgi:hypothetical protein
VNARFVLFIIESRFFLGKPFSPREASFRREKADFVQRAVARVPLIEGAAKAKPD